MSQHKEIVSTIRITLSNYCTINCFHCFIPIEERKNKSIISDENIIDLIKNYDFINNYIESNISKNVKKEVIIFGGEIFDLNLDILYDKLNLIFSSLNNHDSITINSSLLFKKDEKIEKIFDFLNTLNNVSIMFSYDMENRFKNEKEFELMIENLKFLQKYNFIYGLNFTLTRNVYNNLEKAKHEIKLIQNNVKNLNINFNILEETDISKRKAEKMKLSIDEIKIIYNKIGYEESSLEEIINENEDKFCELENKFDNGEYKVLSMNFELNSDIKFNTIKIPFCADIDLYKKEIYKLLLKRYYFLLTI